MKGLTINIKYYINKCAQFLEKRCKPILHFLAQLFKLLFCLLLILLLLIIDGIFSLNYSENDIGGGYKYLLDSPSYIYKSNTIIPPKIYGYGYNKRFIVAKQLVDEFQYTGWKDVYDKYDYPNYNDVYYWIIDKKEEKIYGPLFYYDYKNKCDSLNINLSFNLW